MYRKKMKNAGGPNLTDKIGAKVKLGNFIYK